MNRRLLLVALVATVGLLTSCFTFQPAAFESTFDENFLRVDAQRDTLEWIEIKHGLNELQGNVSSQLATFLEGKPVYMMGGMGLTLELKQLLEALPNNRGEAETAATERVSEILAGVRVVDARLVLDNNDAPSLWRRIILEHASEWVATLSLPPVSEDFDAATNELIAKADSSGRGTWSMQGNALAYEVPISEDFAERLRQSLNSGGGASLGSNGLQRSVDGTFLRARLVPDSSGWLSGKTDAVITPQAASEMRVQLEERGFSIEPHETYKRLHAAVGLP